MQRMPREYDHRMTSRKQRVTISVDPALIRAGTAAVAGGDADSLSGWVATALAEKIARDVKLAALRDAIADYEAEFGEIGAAEVAAQVRADRAESIVVRGRVSKSRPRRSARSV